MRWSGLIREATMAADTLLGPVRADARRPVPDPPPVEELVEDAGRQRLAACYLYTGLLAGVGDEDLAPARWPPEVAEPMQRLGLGRLAPRTSRGLDAQLTPAEQVTRRSRGRKLEFGQLLVDLINHGALRPLRGQADRVRLARPGDGRGLELKLLRSDGVVRTCTVRDHWELVAQYLAGAPPDGPLADARTARGSQQPATWLKTSGLGHAVSLGTALAVGLQPLGAAGLGTKLAETRIQARKDQADALRRLGQQLRTLYTHADGEVADLLTMKRA
jgi:hypothetical protein